MKEQKEDTLKEKLRTIEETPENGVTQSAKNIKDNDCLNDSDIKLAQNIEKNKCYNIQNINPSPNHVFKKRETTAYETRKTSYTYKKKFPEKNYGRIPNKEKVNGKKGKHTKNNADNGKKNLIVKCVRNIHNVFKYYSWSYYGIKLLIPTIIPQMGKKKTDRDLKILFNKSMKKIYYASRPKNKRNNNFLEMKNNIKKILRKEKNKEGIKLLAALFNAKLKEILIMYLKDDPRLNYINGKVMNRLFLHKFVTFKGFDHLQPLIKNRFRDNLLKLLGQ